MYYFIQGQMLEWLDYRACWTLLTFIGSENSTFDKTLCKLINKWNDSVPHNKR